MTDGTQQTGDATQQGNQNGTGSGSTSIADAEYFRSRAQRFEAELVDLQKKFEKVKDINPDEFHAIKTEYDRLRTENAKTPEEFEALLNERLEKEVGKVKNTYGEKLTSAESELDTLRSEIKRLRVDNVVRERASGVINKEYMDLVDPIISKHCQYEDGEIVIVDADGKVRTSPSDPRKNMQIEELFAELIEKYPRIAEDKARSGTARSVASKSTGQPASAGGMTVEQYNALTPQERASLPADVQSEMDAKMLGIRRRR